MENFSDFQKKVCYVWIDMKAKQASDALTLEQIPNIGPSIAEDLRTIGISKPIHLKGKDGIALYHILNKMSGVRHDACVADTFMAAVDFMDGGKPLAWWHFTAKRKQLLRLRE